MRLGGKVYARHYSLCPMAAGTAAAAEGLSFIDCTDKIQTTVMRNKSHCACEFFNTENAILIIN